MAYRKMVVIQRRSVQYAECGGIEVPVPCGDDAVDIHGEYFAVPVKAEGVFRGYKFQKAESAPTYDSFPVVKVKDKANGETYWVIGTLDEFFAKCADNTNPATVALQVVPEICLCVEEGSTTVTRFTLPPLGDHTNFKIYLGVDNVLVLNGETNGDAFDAADDIATYLIANHASVGTWLAVGTDVIQLTVSADKCVGLVAVPFTP